MVYTCTKDYVKYDGHNADPGYIFFSGTGGTGKSILVKEIYTDISKTLFYNFSNPKKPKSSLTWAYRNITGKYR